MSTPSNDFDEVSVKNLHEDETLLRNEHMRCLEAYIFASPEPVPLARLKEVLPKSKDVEPLLEELSRFYTNRGFQLVQRGSAWAFRTDPALAHVLTTHRKQKRRLSRQSLETLAIIAYKQPITRPEIEMLRGVSVSRGIFANLLEHKWIAPGTRRKIPGRPLTWTTTNSLPRSLRAYKSRISTRLERLATRESRTSS